MRSLKRLNFVMRQETYRASDADSDLSMESVSASGGSGGSSADVGEYQAPSIVSPVDEAVVHDQALEPFPSPRHPLAGMREGPRHRKWFVTENEQHGHRRDAAPELTRDREITDRIVTLVRDLNEVMDQAVRQGLIVEPVLTQVKGRYGAVDEEGGYMLSLKLFRKLC